MEIAAGLVKLKPHSKETVKTWHKEIEKRKIEALATLQDEGVQVESWFELQIAGEDYLLWYMRADSIENVWEVASKSKHDIDALHFRVMAKITAKDGEIPASPILDLYNEAYNKD